uniref:Secreted protein n=1 Tax=Macrostomum lignano TaxID=282301 RepID=A0A1I8F3C9_9PLAT
SWASRSRSQHSKTQTQWSACTCSIIGLFWCHLRSEEMRRSGLTGDRLLMEPELNAAVALVSSDQNSAPPFCAEQTDRLRRQRALGVARRATRRDPPDH